MFLRTPARSRLVGTCAALMVAIAVGCGGPATPTTQTTPVPAAATPTTHRGLEDPFGQPIEGAQPTPAADDEGPQEVVPGILLSSRCVRAEMTSRRGAGRLSGNGLLINLDSDSVADFSRALADVDEDMCKEDLTAADVDTLIARMRQLQGVRVTSHTWSGP